MARHTLYRDELRGAGPQLVYDYTDPVASTPPGEPPGDPPPNPGPTPIPMGPGVVEVLGKLYTFEVAPNGDVTPPLVDGERRYSVPVQTPYTLDVNIPAGVRKRFTVTKGSNDAMSGPCHVSIDGTEWLARGEGFQAPVALNGQYPPFAPGFHRIRVVSSDPSREVVQFVELKSA